MMDRRPRTATLWRNRFTSGSLSRRRQASRDETRARNERVAEDLARRKAAREAAETVE
jgi:hypothetical protein